MALGRVLVRADKHTPCKIKNSMKSKMISRAKAGVKLKT